MASTYAVNTGIELIADGEQSGTWGDTTNTNLQIVDRLTSGVGAITLSGTTHTLSTSDGALSEGQYKVLVFGGSPSGTNTVTVTPNDQSKQYFIVNNSGQSVIISQGSGSNVTVANGATDIIYCDGAGSGAAVASVIADLSGFLTAANNLSDLASAATALTNLGLTATASEINVLDGVTSTTAELNILDGVTSTTAELNYSDITTLGTSEASKVVTADANGVVTFDNGIVEESTAITSSSNAATLDLHTGTNFTHTLTEDVTYTFSNSGASGRASAFTLKVTQDSTARTITWPSSVDWNNSTAPTLSTGSGEVDVFVFITYDGGTTYYGFAAGQAMG
jgi:hypothetical protein